MVNLKRKIYLFYDNNDDVYTGEMLEGPEDADINALNEEYSNILNDEESEEDRTFAEWLFSKNIGFRIPNYEVVNCLAY